MLAVCRERQREVEMYEFRVDRAADVENRLPAAPDPLTAQNLRKLPDPA